MLKSDVQTNSKKIMKVLLPSVMGTILYFVVSSAVIIINFVLLSFSQGAFLPNAFNGVWAETFTNYITRPLLVLSQNSFLARTLSAVLWGLFGLSCYALVKYIQHSLNQRKQKVQLVHFSGTDIEQYDHARDEARLRLLRRGASVVGVIVLYWVAGPSIADKLSKHVEIYMGSITGIEAWKMICLTILQLAFFCHVLIVIIRVYKDKLRLF